VLPLPGCQAQRELDELSDQVAKLRVHRQSSMRMGALLEKEQAERERLAEELRVLTKRSQIMERRLLRKDPSWANKTTRAHGQTLDPKREKVERGRFIMPT
ncbi:hypothetical protein KIPB_012352, partial [Kipferlia bialata]